MVWCGCGAVVLCGGDVMRRRRRRRRRRRGVRRRRRRRRGQKKEEEERRRRGGKRRRRGDRNKQKSERNVLVRLSNQQHAGNHYQHRIIMNKNTLSLSLMSSCIIIHYLSFIIMIHDSFV